MMSTSEDKLDINLVESNKAMKSEPSFPTKHRVHILIELSNVSLVWKFYEV